MSVLQNSGEKEMSSSATLPPLGLLNATSKTTWRGRRTDGDSRLETKLHADAHTHANVHYLFRLFHWFMMPNWVGEKTQRHVSVSETGKN